ncbi:MAG TPA: DcuS/MalK family sensor histidine kinase [Negativicutes bacterium]|nr:DcuS/MalK family sensor histidine kinase [Negativicutes bacterium]
MHDHKRPGISLQSQIILLVCGIVAVALLIANVCVTRSIANTVRDNQGEKAMDISRTVALSQLVVEGLDGERGDQVIRDYTRSIRIATKVEFVVVFNMQGIRKSHPNEERVGQPLVGGDEIRALQGEEYISFAKGTLGPSLRAFSPVRTKDGRQVGAVVVGILLNDVENAVDKSQTIIYWATAFGLVAGLVGAVALARSVKRTLFGLEPFAIAKLLEERNSMLQSAREGVLAVDGEGIITVINSEAVRIFGMAGLTSRPIGQPVEQCIPHTRLAEILRTGQAEFDQEQDINGVIVLTNRVPLVVKGEIVGALATFRDMTEIRQLAEELTGVNGYLEALRARAHEFLNNLHVIRGLARIKQYEKLDEYIARVLNESREEVAFVGERIKEPILAGVVLSKLSRARESGVLLVIDENSNLPRSLEPETAYGLVTVLGNLLDNAFEAVKDSVDHRADLFICYAEGFVTIQVSDRGLGIDPAIKEKLFEKGYSTKGEGRGLGLFLVAKAIEKMGGVIEVDSNVLNGAVFRVAVPYSAGGDTSD